MDILSVNFLGHKWINPDFNPPGITQIEATVLQSTADGLKEISEKAELSVGEVIDRLTMQFTPREPDIAVQIILQEISMAIVKLTPEQCLQAIQEVFVTLAVSLPEEVIDELPQLIMKKNEELKKQVLEMTDEEWKEISDELENLNRKRDEE